MTIRGTFKFDKERGEVVQIETPKREPWAPVPATPAPKLYTGFYL